MAKSRTLRLLSLSLCVTNIICEPDIPPAAVDLASAREDRDLGHGGGAAVSSGYGAPTDTYGAPSSGYGAASAAGAGGYAAASGGYAAPSGGYGAPCDSYGCSGAPVYVYQQGQGQQQVDGGGAGALAALLPLGALALLVPLGLLAFGTLFPTTTIVSGRRRRSADVANMTAVERQTLLLHSYMSSLQQLPELSLQQDMVARYLECPGHSAAEPEQLHGCLQKLSCVLYDTSVNISDMEREVADIVLKSIFENKFVSKDLKRRLQVAGKKGSRSPGSCDVFKCHHHLLPQQYN